MIPLVVRKAISDNNPLRLFVITLSIVISAKAVPTWCILFELTVAVRVFLHQHHVISSPERESFGGEIEPLDAQSLKKAKFCVVFLKNLDLFQNTMSFCFFVWPIYVFNFVLRRPPASTPKFLPTTLPRGLVQKVRQPPALRFRSQGASQNPFKKR